LKNEQNKPMTIKDIAAEAGVSICTVSRVLNKSDLVGKKTKKKVERVIEENGYIPNEMARSLLRKKSRTIALLIPDLSNPFYAELFFGIEEVMSSEGYYVYVCNTNYKMENERRYIKELIGRGIDGMIFMSLYYCGEDIFDFVRKNVSAVAVQTKVRDMDLIVTDVQETGAEAIRHLFELGHRKIGYICFDKKTNVERLHSYLISHKEAGVPVKDEYVIDGYTPDTLGYMAAKRLLSLPEPPTAIQAFNDYTALGVYQAVIEAGLNIPKDISIVSYDDIKIAGLLNPPLTTVNQPIQEMGRTAGDLLLKNISRGAEHLPKEIHLPSKFVIRSSTAPPAR